ncbi:MAG: hypothetical protein Q4G69_10765 [Planctomycetia bacterium]|nr:hypothetical protein [Planctomycetia bacterium]
MEDKILPVRLSPFEEYLFLDQKSNFPMSENMDWVFRGRVDHDLIEKALRKAAEKEPLFFAKVKKRCGKYYWTTDASAEIPSISWSRVDHDLLSDQEGIIPLHGIDIQNSPGIQISIIEGSGSFIIRTLFHHSVVDGMGATIFMGNWIAIYQRLLNKEFDSDPLLTDPKAFLDRENLHIVPPEPIPFSAVLKTLTAEIFKWFWRRPISLIPLQKRRKKENLCSKDSIVRRDENENQEETNRASDGSLLPGQYWKTFSAEFLSNYHKRAKENGVSVNTLFLRDLYLTLHKWSQLTPREEKKSRRYFRVLVPMSLRKKEHAALPLANILGYVFIDELPRSCDRSTALLKKFNDLMKFVLKWSSGAIFIEGARFFRRFPGLLSLMTSRFFCHSSIVFSNTGILCKCLQQEAFRKENDIRIPDELELIRIIGSPPVRPNTPISIGLITHKNEFTLTLCADRNVFDQESLQEFYEMYRSEMENTLNEQI